MPPVRLFLIGFAVVSLITLVSVLTGAIGTIALDMFRSDSGFFNVDHFGSLNPWFFAALAGIYAIYGKISRQPLSSVLVSIHFWTTVAFALLVVYLAHNRVDVPVPDWRYQMADRFNVQSAIFVVARIAFVASQLLFVLNLACSYRIGRRVRAQAG